MLGFVCAVATPASVFPLVPVWFGRIGFLKGSGEG